VGVGQSMYRIEDYVAVNTSVTAKLLQRLVDGESDVKRLVVASSMSIYGEGGYRCPDCGVVHPALRSEEQLKRHEWELRCPWCQTEVEPIPTSESKPLAPTSIYAITKRDQEEMCLTIGRAYGIPTVALRFFNVYGPRQALSNPYTGVCAIFQSRIRNDRAPIIFEDGHQTRDFVSVHDVVRACLLAAERSAAVYQAVNVGSGRPASVIDIARVLLKLYGKELSLQVENTYRAGDVRHCFADISRAKELLGYQPQVPLEEGLREFVEWSRDQEAEDRLEEAHRELAARGLVEK
ncbi:MAG: NAD-dependent epimerase/dehydratase family protein, partial [Thermoplasmata archaeon]